MATRNTAEGGRAKASTGELARVARMLVDAQLHLVEYGDGAEVQEARSRLERAVRILDVMPPEVLLDVANSAIERCNLHGETPEQAVAKTFDPITRNYPRAYALLLEYIGTGTCVFDGLVAVVDTHQATPKKTLIAADVGRLAETLGVRKMLWGTSTAGSFYRSWNRRNEKK